VKDSVTIKVLGHFDNSEIRDITDVYGKSWFTALDICQALEVDRSTISHILNKNSEEFAEEDTRDLTVDGKRQLVFSEEGFLTICDLSSSPVAYHLRKWLRQQFRVRRDEDRGIVVYHKSQDPEDLSDIDRDYAYMRHMLDRIFDNRRQIEVLKASSKALQDQQVRLTEDVEESQKRIDEFESRFSIKPGEMTSTQLARHVRWVSSSGAPHNTAVILAAVNECFLEQGLMRQVEAVGPMGRPTPEWIFSPGGVSLFLTTVDASFHTGQRFTVAPNTYAKNNGYKNKRHVRKV